MMNISRSADKIIKRYGCSVTVENGDRSVSARAFVQPLRYRYRENAGGKRHISGRKKSSSFLFVGTADISLEADVSVIQMQGRKYIVKRCETYFVKDCPVYVWAVLSPFGAALEDDYEQN